MKNSLKFIVTLLILIVGISCTHKRYAKKAQKFEEQGLYQEAADWFYQSVLAKHNYLEAQMGLKRTGQRVIDDLYKDFMLAYNQGNDKQAVYHYLDAVDYENKLLNVDVKLNVPPYYEEYYNEIKNEYLNKQYSEAVKRLNDEDFSTAETIFKEIKSIDVSYKDVNDKLDIAIFEPKYRHAVKQMGNKKYRTAYYLFGEILNGYGNYKESADLQVECKEKSTLKIAIQDIDNQSNKTELSHQIKSQIITGLNNSNNPFLKVIEMPEGTSSQNQKIRNKSIQPDAIVKGIIYKFTDNAGRLVKEEKRGYLETKTQHKNEDGTTHTETNYEKVKYNEYQQQRSVNIQFELLMVDTRTSEILIMKNFDMSNEDNVHYATFKGQQKNLIPGYWKNKFSTSNEDIMKNNYNDRQKLYQLLNARKEIKNFNALTTELINELSNQAVEKINNYNPE